MTAPIADRGWPWRPAIGRRVYRIHRHRLFDTGPSMSRAARVLAWLELPAHPDETWNVG